MDGISIMNNVKLAKEFGEQREKNMLIEVALEEVKKKLEQVTDAGKRGNPNPIRDMIGLLGVLQISFNNHNQNQK